MANALIIRRRRSEMHTNRSLPENTAWCKAFNVWKPGDSPRASLTLDGRYENVLERELG
jgi:hypothetical protein